MAPDARFNHAGQSVFYLASSKEVAIAEALGDRPSGLLWIQEFRVNPVGQILDLSVEAEQLPDDQDLLVALLESEAFTRAGGEADSNWKPGYLLPRFIADCAKHSGHAGIQYPSARAYGDNVVLLDPKAIRDSVSEVGPPETAVRRPRGKPRF
jgi:RES domain-containing protein